MFSAITGYLILEPERLLKAGSRHCRNSNYWQQLLHNSPSQTSAGTGFSESGAMRALPIVGLLPVRISPQYKNLAQK
jgi:hypothetical protein